MIYSDSAIKILAAKECGIIKSNVQFWKEFSEFEKFEQEISKNENFGNTLIKIKKELEGVTDQEGIICFYDEYFPVINRKIKNNGDKPYLLFYKGNLQLLSDLNKNVAVIGLTNPDDKIAKREYDVVKRLTTSDLVIVSGLANGCDSIAHKACLAMSGKTIAILPTQISKIYPAENKILAEEIVEKGGLLISEYYKEAASRYEAINRFIQRDRLQAMFSKAIIMVASYRKGEGDSGSRHAMEAARKYEIERYVIYNKDTDSENKQFALNKDLIAENSKDKVKVLLPSSIEHIKEIKNENLISTANTGSSEQLSLL